MTTGQGGGLQVEYRLNPAIGNDQLNALFDAAWTNHARSDFAPVLARSLAFVCAYAANRLVGFVNLAWDGGVHAFVLDTTVHPDWRRRGIGRQLVRHAVDVAQGRGIEWVHVDFEPELRGFYYGCGFRPTDAGVMRVAPRDLT